MNRELLLLADAVAAGDLGALPVLADYLAERAEAGMVREVLEMAWGVGAWTVEQFCERYDRELGSRCVNALAALAIRRGADPEDGADTFPWEPKVVRMRDVCKFTRDEVFLINDGYGFGKKSMVRLELVLSSVGLSLGGKS